MLNLGKFPTQLQYNVVLHNPITKATQFPAKSHFSYSVRLNFEAVIAKTRSGLCCNALKTKKKGSLSVEEMGDFDEFDDEDFDDEFLDESDTEEDGGTDVDDDGLDVPLKNMKKWLAKRPRGFGEGKVYDTTIEDKLMEEMEQSRSAQLANLNKLKNNPVNSNSKKETSKKDEDLQHSHDGFRVRLVNLPKKKNIHRDLRLAFQGIPGIVRIVPVVSGNEKTRDPVCKGLAFVDFKNKDEAQRFMQSFSGKSICFGKLEKQIKCEMVNSKLPKPERGQSVDVGNFPSQQNVLIPDEVYSLDERHVSEQHEEDDRGINVTSTTSINDLGDEPEEEDASAIKSSLLKQTSKAKKQPKKVASRRVKANAPKLNIPGSAKKLEVGEKAVLSDVFSKYGAAAAASTVKEHSR